MDPEPPPNKEAHLSIKMLALGSAGGSFAAIITLSLMTRLPPFLTVALYLFAVALPLLITAALLSEFTAFGETRKSGESLAVCFFAAGYITALVALGLLLANVYWAYALALVLPSFIGFFTIRYALRSDRG